MCQHVPPSEKKNFFEEIKGIDTAIHPEIFLKFPSPQDFPSFQWGVGAQVLNGMAQSETKTNTHVVNCV